MADGKFPKHYKHKTIARFSVGPYHFVNHILQIEDHKADTDFLREVDGLLMVDKINIVEILNLENERPVEPGQRTTHGMLGTAGVKLSDSTAEAKNAELAKRSQELTEREAILAARERRLAEAEGKGNLIAAFDGTKAGDGVVADTNNDGVTDSLLDESGNQIEPVTIAPVVDETPASDPATAPAPAPAPGPRIGGLKLGSAQ